MGERLRFAHERLPLPHAFWDDARKFELWISYSHSLRSELQSSEIALELVQLADDLSVKYFL